jgi:quercetin dioxygenase-like cupin family protein
MRIFDTKTLQTFPFSERHKNVFFKVDEFKIRIIKLNKGLQLPECQMSSYVIFSLVSGEVEVMVNNEKSLLKEGELMVSGPAKFSMKAIRASCLLGFQINKQKL